MLTTLVLSLVLLLSTGWFIVQDALASWVVPHASAVAAVPSPQQAIGPADPGELSAWLDPFIEQHMAQTHIPGAVLVVVKDGKVFYSKGYGLADVASKRPVDPEHSVWRVMSLSKPVTALAVLQLAEQGKLDLNADVNHYLKHFQLPATFPQPVTADRLLTHSAGLDWDVDDIGTQAAAPERLLGLSPYLTKRPPARVLPPGQQYLYSNGAYDILGALVEDISGLPFTDYVAQHVLDPLGMDKSSFAQPPAAEDLVTAYDFNGADVTPLPVPLWQDPPSRSLTSTAPDMARLLVALLGDGHTVVQPATLANMLSTHFSYQPDMPGWAYGFDRFTGPGEPALSKDGRAPGALSRIVLLPDRKVGWFLAYNLDDDNALANEVGQEFLKHYYPFQPQFPAPTAGALARAQPLTGVYRPLEYSHHTIAKLLRLSWPDYPIVSALPDGRLAARFGPDPQELAELVEVAPLHYRTADGGLDYVFLQDVAGRVTGFTAGSYVAERVARYDTEGAHQLALLGFVLVFLAGALAWPLVLLIRRRQHRPGVARPVGRRSAWLLTAVAAMNFCFLVILYVVLNVADIDYSFGMPTVLVALLVGLLVANLLTLSLVAALWWVWRRKALPRTGVVLYGLFTLVALAFIPWLNYWNLIGLRW